MLKLRDTLFWWAGTVYGVSLLVILPLMSWRDGALLAALFLLGCALGRWKESVYRSHVFSLLIGYLAARPLLNPGGFSADWPWQAYVVVAGTILLGIIFLIAGRRVKPGNLDMLSWGVIFGLAGLVGSCMLPWLVGWSSGDHILLFVLACSCFAVAYVAFVRRFSAKSESS